MVVNRCMRLGHTVGFNVWTLSVWTLSIWTLLLMGWGPVSGQAAIATVTHTSQFQSSSTFVPPRRGLPARREGGGSR